MMRMWNLYRGRSRDRIEQDEGLDVKDMSNGRYEAKH